MQLPIFLFGAEGDQPCKELTDKDFKDLGFGFRFHCTNTYEKAGTINCYVSKFKDGPDIFLYHHIKIGRFNLRFDRRQWSNNDMIARGFKCDSLKELQEFLSKFDCFTS